MVAQKEKLKKGIIANGQTEKFAETLWALFEPFQAYGFNKAHAASYGMVAYQTAYLKANYPAEYMSAALTAESGDVEKIAEIIEGCKKMKFLVLPPDINESFSDFTVVLDDKKNVTNKIRFGLLSIKNFGEEIGKAIITERKTNGEFKSLGDFLSRIKHKNLNKKSLEALVMAGAFDSMGERGSMISNMEDMLAFNHEIGRADVNQTSLFGNMPSIAPEFKLKPAKSADNNTKLKWEKELLGLYISGHPLDKYRSALEKSNMSIKTAREIYGNGMQTKMLLIVEEVKMILTKKNERMAFVKFSDLTGSIEGVVFPSVYIEAKDLLEGHKCLLVSAKISVREGSKSLIVEKIKEMV